MPNLKAISGAALNAVPAVTGVTITPAGPTSVMVGATVALGATVAGTNNPPQRVLWSTSDATLATVDALSGVVTGVAAGSVTITATDRETGAFSDTRSVTVTVPTPTVVDVIISPNPTTCLYNGTRLLTITVDVLNGAGDGWTVTSDDPSVASVAASDATHALVTGHAAGTAHITARSTYDTAVFDVATITVPVPSVSIAPTPNPFTLAPTATQAMTPNVTAVNGATSGVTWSSSNPAVATVDASTGLVTAVAVGSATITATSTWDGTTTGSASATVASVITITQQPTDVQSNSPFSPVVTVSLSGAPDGTPVTASIASGTGRLSGTVTRGTISGVATFTGLTIIGLGAHTIAFSATGYTGATSSSVTMAGYANAGDWVSGTVNVVNRYLNPVAPYYVPLTFGILIPAGAIPGDTSLRAILHYVASLEKAGTAWNVRESLGNGIIADGFSLIAENDKANFPAFVIAVRVPDILALTGDAGNYFNIANCRWTHRRGWEQVLDLFNATYTYDRSAGVLPGGFSAGGQNMWASLYTLFHTGRIASVAAIVSNSARLDAFQLAPPVASTWSTVLVDDRIQGTPPNGKYLVCTHDWDYLSYGYAWDLPSFDPMAYSARGVNNIYNDANLAADDLFESWFPGVAQMQIAGESDPNYKGKAPGSTTTNAFPGVIKGGLPLANGFEAEPVRGQGQTERWDSQSTRRRIVWYGVDGTRTPVHCGAPPGSGQLPTATIDYSKFNIATTDKSVSVTFAQTSGTQWGHGAVGYLYQSGYNAPLGYSELSYLFWVGAGRDYSAAPWAWLLAQRAAVLATYWPRRAMPMRNARRPLRRR